MWCKVSIEGLTHGSPMVSAADSAEASVARPRNQSLLSWGQTHDASYTNWQWLWPNDQTNWATYPSYLEKMCVPKSTFFTQCENGSSKKLYFVMQPSQPAQKTGKVCFFTKRRGCKSNPLHGGQTGSAAVANMLRKNSPITWLEAAARISFTALLHQLHLWLQTHTLTHTHIHKHTYHTWVHTHRHAKHTVMHTYTHSWTDHKSLLTIIRFPFYSPYE